MKCPKCAHTKKMKKSREDFDYSETSGIPGAILNGVTTYTCLKCENKIHDLGPIEDVTNAFIDVLLGASIIPRSSVRFIRTHYFEESEFEFAKRVGTTPQHIQDLEKSRKILSLEISRKIQDAIIEHRATDVSIVFGD